MGRLLLTAQRKIGEAFWLICIAFGIGVAVGRGGGWRHFLANFLGGALIGGATMIFVAIVLHTAVPDDEQQED